MRPSVPTIGVLNRRWSFFWEARAVTKMRLVAGHDELKEPGDFYYRFGNGESAAPTYIVMILPNGEVCGALPLQPEPHNPGERGWGFAGPNEAPTLHPSVWFAKDTPRSWHGWIRDGEMHEA